MLNKNPTPSRAPIQTDPKHGRRSSRLTIEIPVEVICKGTSNSVQVEETRTIVVSAHGCALPLKSAVMPGDTVVVIHKMSREEVSCRVIMCRQQSKEGGWDTGLEFQRPSTKFWHIAFPPDDWEPSFRESVAPAKLNK